MESIDGNATVWIRVGPCSGHCRVVDGENLYGTLVCVCSPADETFQVTKVAHAIAAFRAEREYRNGTSGYLVAFAGEEYFFFGSDIGLTRLKRRRCDIAVFVCFPFGYATVFRREGDILICEVRGQYGSIYCYLPFIRLYFVHAEGSCFAPVA